MSNVLQLTIQLQVQEAPEGTNPVILVRWRHNHEDDGDWSRTLPLDAITHLKQLVQRRIATATGQRRLAELERRSLGSVLLRAVAPDEYTLQELRRRIADWTSSGNAIRLVLVMDDHRLEDIPWELLYDSDSELGYLALRPGVSIRRAGKPHEEPRPEGATGPLRIFYVFAGRIPGRTLEEERWANSEGLAAVIDPASLATGDGTWEDVAKGLIGCGEQPNVFHFTGHGERTESGPGRLVFPAPAESPPYAYVGADQVGPVLHQAGVRLAVLAACEVGLGLDWRGFGSDLLKYVEAVVSMQAPVDDVAAQLFCEELYLALGRGWDLDRAVAHARKAAYNSREGQQDWWIPMVHTPHLNSPAFPAHPEVKTRFGSEASTMERSIRIPAAGAAVPFGPDTRDLWQPPESAFPVDNFVLSADGQWCAQGFGDKIRVGRLAAVRFEWCYTLRVEGAQLLAVHGTEFDQRILVSSPSETRVIARTQTPLEYREYSKEDAAAESGAWSGSGFTCIRRLGKRTQCFSLPRQARLTDWSPPPSEGAEMLDVAIYGDRRTAAWVEGKRLVVSSSQVSSGPSGEERRTVTLSRRPRGVVVGRGHDQLVFVREEDDLLGWRWTDLAGG